MEKEFNTLEDEEAAMVEEEEEEENKKIANVMADVKKDEVDTVQNQSEDFAKMEDFSESK